jgi:hypothetical protein|tara:strand:- start:1556 stop:1819 length:264 start_codon:yes stop_codon:yes gene_type:complete
MKDITDRRIIYLKGSLFLLCGTMAAVLLVIEHAEVKVGVLLLICIWCFARAYYFAFYVIEHYVDSTYKFSGLWSFATYEWHRRRQRM